MNSKVIIGVVFSLTFALTMVFLTSGLVQSNYEKYTVSTIAGDIEFDRRSYGYPLKARVFWYCPTLWLDSERWFFDALIFNWLVYLGIGVAIYASLDYLSKLQKEGAKG